VLLLDEPTKRPDIDTLQRLEDLLDGWPGTLVVVSHDRYLIERVCDTVVALLGDGRITHLPGGIEEYLRPPAAAPATGAAAPIATRTPAAAGTSVNGVAADGAGQPSAAERRDAQKEARRLERRLETLNTREAKLHTALAEAATDPPRLLELDAELRAVVAERARWRSSGCWPPSSPKADRGSCPAPGSCPAGRPPAYSRGDPA